MMTIAKRWNNNNNTSYNMIRRTTHLLLLQFLKYEKLAGVEAGNQRHPPLLPLYPARTRYQRSKSRNNKNKLLITVNKSREERKKVLLLFFAFIGICFSVIQHQKKVLSLSHIIGRREEEKVS
jgi:hypothetical protein